jgi:DNA-binding NtrC family response regulator
MLTRRELLVGGPIVALRQAAEAVLDRVAGQRNPTPLLISGETGTGKDLLLEALHRASGRATRPSIAVAVSALPEELLGAELFGRERGAPDGRGHGTPGLFQAASGGMLHLADVAEMLGSSVRRQVVAAIQRGAVRRVEGTRLEPVDVWLVATDVIERAIVLSASDRIGVDAVTPLGRPVD